MRLVLLPIVLLACSVVVRGFEDTTLEDDDFAEFEQFDVDDDATVAGKKHSVQIVLVNYIIIIIKST